MSASRNRSPRFSTYSVEHDVEIVHHLVIREPDHAIAFLFSEPARALSIVLDLRNVTIAVDLNDELGGRAEEVDDETTDGMLAPEAQAVGLPAPKSLPEDLLSWSQGTT